MDEEWVLISSYSRNEAIADGVLIDITALASQRGFRLPTAITATLLGRYLEPSEKLKDMGQSFEGRLHDLLYLTFLAAKNSKDSDRVYFEVLFLNESGGYDKPTIIAHVGPGDDREPVMTIMLPEDD
jgi:hypothetical protein